MSRIQVENLVKRYDSMIAVDDVSFVAEEGKLTSLLGPSGCGKTTTLRCVAGLERPDEGRITIGDQVVTAPDEGIFVPPHKRDIGFVFQSFDVWPHMSVFDNVAYPLQNRNYPRDEIEERVTEALRLTGIEEHKAKPATQLSGGQQARVGICRAIVYEPQVLMFDEPLTGLDRNLRKQMRYEIKRIQSELEITSLYVTHSQPEAMTLSDKICLMNANGKIEQIGTAQEIYNQPQTQFTFDFFGSSEEITGTTTNPKGVETALGVIECDTSSFDPDQDITVGVRPDHIEVSASKKEGWETNTWHGRVDDISFIGEMYELRIAVDDIILRSRQHEMPEDLQEGVKAYVHIDAENIRTFWEEVA